MLFKETERINKIMAKSFKDYIVLKEATSDGNWKQKYINIKPGFIPPATMKPIVEAFLNSGEIKIMDDLGGKHLTLPQKNLFLVGGAVRDFLMGKTPKDFDLATDASPEQIAVILSKAGFKYSGDNSGKTGKDLNLPFEIKKANNFDTKTWFIKGRDSSKDKKPFVISAVVNKTEYEIATFRKDAKISDGQAEVDFVDNPEDDASRRDLTMNALYIILNSADGENSKLYDPTGHGHHDITNKTVRAVGNAEERFREDKLRVLRAIRFHCRFGGGAKMDEELEKAIPKFKHMEGVALERIREEFIKGLTHPDVDAKCYLNIYKRTGLLEKVFPDLTFDSPNGMPMEFSDQKDKPLALAWLLQHNTIEKVAEALSPIRRTGMEDKQTGWTISERNAVLFLLKLKQEFNGPEDLPKFMKMRESSGLSNQQIRDWVEMFGKKRAYWSKLVQAFAGHSKSTKWDDIVNSGGDYCRNCKGFGCAGCGMSGKASPEHRGDLINHAEVEKFKKKVDF